VINYRYLRVPYWKIGDIRSSSLREGDRFPMYLDDCDKPFNDVTCWMIVTELTENLVRVECIGDIRENADPPFDDLPRVKHPVHSVWRPVIYEEGDDNASM
jgi:hypothetical protein